MTLDDDLIPDPALEKASSWALRLQGAPDDSGLRAAVSAWIAESDVNARAWALTQKAWRLTGGAKAAFAHEWPAAPPRQRPVPQRPLQETAATRRPPLSRPSSSRPPAHRRAGIRAATLAFAACLLLVLALPSIQLRLASDHRTEVGESRRLSLDDGSVVHLAPDSAIAVAFAAGARDVILLRGEAFFEVAPDRNRPFSVRAGDLDATVTGTSFDVGLTDRSFSVAVATGSVRVAQAGKPAESAVDLGPGQGVVVDRATGRTTDMSLAPSSVAAWRAGRLIVENARLTDVVETIGRYRAGGIVVASASLRGKRVTGVYDLNDPDGALRVLAAPYGGAVRAFTPYLLVLSAD